jgi:hypothetical protein
MVTNELERVTVEYLTKAFIQKGKLTRPPSPGPPVVVTMPDVGEVRIVKGESNQELELPAVIVACDLAEQDPETTNNYCSMVVIVRVQVDPATYNPQPLQTLHTISDLVMDSLLVGDLWNRLNEFAGPRFTAIASVTLSPVKQPQDRHIDHSLNCYLYCANTNLLGNAGTVPPPH